METLAIVFALFVVYLGLIQIADLTSRHLRPETANRAAANTGDIALIFMVVAVVFAALAAA